MSSKRSKPVDTQELEYLTGFGNHLQSEAVEGALPHGMNNPKQCPFNLYAEQLSGTSFTTPHQSNQKAWLYRTLPSAKHEAYQPIEGFKFYISDFTNCQADPRRFRWKPLDFTTESVGFLEGFRTMMGAGSPDTKTGVAVHLYSCNMPNPSHAYCNADGDYLIVPQEGDLLIKTEFGRFRVSPGEICVIQRGIVFNVGTERPSRGYVCEIYTSHLNLPERGPIGSNGLANERDFQYPTAWFEQEKGMFKVVQKFCGKFFSRSQSYSPFNVVAWHGNYIPYKYDLHLFCAMNSVTFDHPDPSIFTVLTAPTNSPGVAALDFVVFPRRWQVQWDTFRLPYYHRNCMSEFMGNVYGFYEAKPEGFVPGGSTLHSCMSAHGPDAEAFVKSSTASEEPFKLKPSMSFMFESSYIFKLTDFALNDADVDQDYVKCWDGLKEEFIV